MTLVVCTSGLGYYSDLQSLHSEDAITWSVFGTATQATRSTLSTWVADLAELIGLKNVQTDGAEVFLWRRIPHPDNLVPGGPEIDVGILTSNAVILCEAKWQSGVGSSQGKRKNKDQIQLRGEFLQKYGSRIFPGRAEFAVLGVSLFKDAFLDTTPPGIAFRSLTWQEVCALASHPSAEEVERYYKWKYGHTKLGRSACDSPSIHTQGE